MKTSNKILLIAAGCIFALVVVVVIIFRVTAIGQAITTQVEDKISQTAGEQQTKSYDVKDFTELAIAGSWDIKVSRANDYQVTITAPDNLLASLEVTKTGKTLKLGELQNVNLFASSQQIKAEITLPTLTAINGSGASQLDLRDFTTDKMTINFSGAGQLKSSNNYITQLDVICSGAADIDLSQSIATNADIDVSGAAQIKLNVNGGKLTGQISGNASVTYSGKVQSVDIKTSGLAKVTRQE